MNKQNHATAIFNAINTAVNLNNVDLRNAAVQDALARFESEHAALVAVAECLRRRNLVMPTRESTSALANLAAIREGGAK